MSIRSVFQEHFTELAERWKAEAANRRIRTPTSDPAAETLESCARDVVLMLGAVDRATEKLTPAQYGELHGGVTAQTVTRWIRAGELQAEDTPAGYRIARDAVRVLKIQKPQTLDPTG